MAKSKKNTQPEWNGWRVLALFVKRVFDLVENGKLYPAVVMVAMLLVGFIAYLAPEASIGLLVDRYSEWVFSSTAFWALMFVSSNIVWIYLLRLMRSNYQAELERVGRVRSELLHNPDRTPIIQHRSTEEPGNEVYLDPNVSSDDNGDVK